MVGGTHTMRTELINKLAIRLKNEGFDSPAGRQAWGRMVEEIYPQVKKKAESYSKSKGEQYRVDADTLLSIALYEGVKRALTSWDIEKGDFITRLMYMLPNVFTDYIRSEIGVDKRKALGTATSLSTPIDGDNLTLEDTIVDNGQAIEELCLPSIVTELFSLYKHLHGEDKADVAKIIFTYDDKLDLRNKEICRYYGVDHYNATIRKRVERIKKHFQEFCKNNRQLVGL